MRRVSTSLFALLIAGAVGCGGPPPASQPAPAASNETKKRECEDLMTVVSQYAERLSKIAGMPTEKAADSARVIRVIDEATKRLSSDLGTLTITSTDVQGVVSEYQGAAADLETVLRDGRKIVEFSARLVELGKRIDAIVAKGS